MTVLVSASRMLHADGSLSPGWLRVDGEAIAAAGRGEPPSGEEVDLEVDVLAPGFVDGHCHGGGGASLCTTDPAEALRAIEAHRRLGTTSIVGGVVTDTIPTMAAQVGVLADLVDDGELAGVYLEGPWLNRRFAGAHDPGLLLPPETAAIDSLLEAGRGSVRLVTIAPELPGGMDAVRYLSDAEVTVAIGHTDADAAVAAEAVEAGAVMATHLFNAMRPIHHRDPGPVPVLLGERRVAVELIADGVHVDPAVLELAARSARGGFTLVSDAFAGAFAPDGTYRLGGLEVTVGGGRRPAHRDRNAGEQHVDPSPGRAGDGPVGGPAGLGSPGGFDHAGLPARDRGGGAAGPGTACRPGGAQRRARTRRRDARRGLGAQGQLDDGGAAPVGGLDGALGQP